MNRSRPLWTAEKLREQGLWVTVEVAAEFLDMSRSAAYGAIKRGVFPVPVRTDSKPWKVATADLLRLAGYDVT